MGTAENKDIVRLIYEDAISNHNLDLLDHYIVPDYVNHKMPGGLQAVKQMFSTLLEAFPDLGMSVDSIGAEGDRVWVRITMRGTQQGPFMGGACDRQDVCGRDRERGADPGRQARGGMGRHRHAEHVAAARNRAGDQLTCRPAAPSVAPALLDEKVRCCSTRCWLARSGCRRSASPSPAALTRRKG